MFLTCVICLKAYVKFITVAVIHMHRSYKTSVKIADWTACLRLLEWFHWCICMLQDTRPTPTHGCIQTYLSVFDSLRSCLCKDRGWLKGRTDETMQRLARCRSSMPCSKLLSVCHRVCYSLQSLSSQWLGQEAHGGPTLYGTHPLKFPLLIKLDICFFFTFLLTKTFVIH